MTCRGIVTVLIAVYNSLFLGSEFTDLFYFGLILIPKCVLQGSVEVSVLSSIPCTCRLLVGYLFFAIFMGHENGDNNKGKPRDDTCKACWMKQILLPCSAILLFYDRF